ncbi:hypothetical protein [Symmachiella dynata]|uniref:hypothetical protein n=1 Tax=Symmachiella dynata TaxID=2527995 RepID=UPI0030EF0672
MPEPSEVVFSFGSQLWIFFTQIGGVGVIWLVGLYLCYSRRDLPQTPRMLIAISLGIQLFSMFAMMVVSGVVVTFMDETGRSLRDMNWLFGFINYTQVFMKMLAHGLMLYAIFGNFRSRPNWDAVAMESEMPEE